MPDGAVPEMAWITGWQQAWGKGGNGCNDLVIFNKIEKNNSPTTGVVRGWRQSE
jgi:hypothetical protein